MSPTTSCALCRGVRHRRGRSPARASPRASRIPTILLRTERGTYILTLYEKRVDPADLPFFLALMEHLAAQGIACPTPLHGRDGVALRQLCGRPAAIVSFLDGHVAAAHPAAPLRRAGRRARAPASGRRRLRARRGRTISRWRAGAGSIKPAAPRAHEVRAGPRRGIGPGARRARARMAGRPAEGRHPRRSLPRQRVLPRREASPASSISISPAPTSSPTTSPSASTPGASRPMAASTSPRRGCCSRITARSGRSRPPKLAALPILARGSALRFLLTRLYDLAQSPAGRPGAAEGSARISAEAALPPRHDASPRIRPRRMVSDGAGTRASSISSPTAPAAAIPGRAAGARCCAMAATRKSSWAPPIPPPTTAWS